MSEFIESSQRRTYKTYRRTIQRYTPRRFGQQSWHRFLLDRTTILVRRCGGKPDERQCGLIEAMINAEWQAMRCEAASETPALRNATPT